jgi:hypothetical protein
MWIMSMDSTVLKKRKIKVDREKPCHPFQAEETWQTSLTLHQDDTESQREFLSNH